MDGDAPATFAPDDADAGPPSLDGKTVVLIHPAWHSCGSYQVFATQARAYAALGARVHALAIADVPGAAAGSRAARAYMAATAEFPADSRHYAGTGLAHMASGGFLRDALAWLHGNEAAMLIGLAGATPIPAAIRDVPRVDLVHCNHFFCMPAAVKAARGCPIIADTHDLQAAQFALRTAAARRLPPRTRYEEMLAVETTALAQADLLLHLNDAEAVTFQNQLPERRHALLYPAIAPVATGEGGGPCVVVASANHPNVQGVIWLLEQVVPRAPDATIRIYGTVDQGVRATAPALFKRHAALFAGRVDDLDTVYATASAILLPTLSGHGLSIKTVEAMSSGAPLVALRAAFRGIAIDPARLANVRLAEDAAGFAGAVRAATLDRTPRDRSPTRRMFERLFGFDAYARGLGRHASALLRAAPTKMT